MKIGFGLVTCQRHPGDPEKRSEVVLYQQALELARLTDRAGLASYWVSEHHFFDDGYASSMFAVLAAAAAVTERITLGSGVLLAPLWHPLHVAEDAATVDVISQGRFILGLGLGWREEEYLAFGVSPKSRVRALEQTIAILRDAWRSNRLVTEAKVEVRPKPVQPNGPAIWIGADVDAAVLRAGRMGNGFIASVRSFETFERQVALLRQAGSRVTISAVVPVFVWDGPENAWLLVREYFGYTRWKYDDMRSVRSRTGAAPFPPALGPEREMQLRRSIICGRPQEVLDGMRRFANLLTEDGHFVAWAYHPGLPWSMQCRQVELLGEIARRF